MEETKVVIVGAGPSGLVLALSLAQHGVKSIILEKENGIEQDPRGVVIQGDAVRFVYSLGLGEHISEIGHVLKDINFHVDTFQRKPFLIFNDEGDANEQSLPSAILQIQPRFERAMRDLVEKSNLTTLRTGCKVIDRKETADGVIVEYENGRRQSIGAKWLVGADGKTGVVRKRFLEPVGIKQEVGIYEYTATWIAANLKIELPTPETHSKFPLWDLGYSPEEVFELFWPPGWHFCTHPTRATASGQFGPLQERLWRHEFAIPDWRDGMDVNEELWKHLMRSITRDAQSFPGLDQQGPVSYPRDCITILRNRPFTFTQKVATPKWFHDRTIIIGDAAHVFPPFGGQGIASGIRDAIGLSWRLSMLQHHESISKPLSSDHILGTWNRERRKGIDDAVRATMTNGRITNQSNSFLVLLQVLVGKLLMSFPALMRLFKANVLRKDLSYRCVKNGFFSPTHHGGGTLSQVYMRTTAQGKPFLSDKLLQGAGTLLTIIAVADNILTQEIEELNALLENCEIDPYIISRRSVVWLSGVDTRSEDTTQDPKPFGAQPHHLCSANELRGSGIVPILGYDEMSYRGALGLATRYAIVRPDCVIFATARSVEEFGECLDQLRILLH